MMVNHGDFSHEAHAGAHGKARAAEVFADHAEHIVGALPDVPDGHVLVAVVGADHDFVGTHHVKQDDIVERVPVLEGDGWAMVFTSGTNVAEVQRRTEEMATLARRRAEMITRIRSRRAPD